MPELENEGAEQETETQEELNTAFKRLESLSRGDGSVVTMTKPELSLLHKELSTGSQKFENSQIWRMMSFLDAEEALDHVAAFHEAQDLGMDTDFNIDFAYSLCSANRKGGFINNLIAVINETLQHGKWATAQKAKTNDSGRNPRSPLSQQY